jgi:hypothetical protein
MPPHRARQRRHPSTTICAALDRASKTLSYRSTCPTEPAVQGVRATLLRETPTPNGVPGAAMRVRSGGRGRVEVAESLSQ